MRLASWVIVLAALGFTLAPSSVVLARGAGTLSLTIVDRIGHGEPAAFTVYEAGGADFGDPHLTPADLKHPDAFIARLRNPQTPIEKALAPVAAPAATVSAVVAALNTAFERDQSALFAANAPSADTQALLQQRSSLSPYGDHRLFYLRLNRLLLEDALPGEVVHLRPLGLFAAGGQAQVPPGDYWLVASDQPVLRQRVHAGNADAGAVTLSAPDALYLTFVGNPPSVRRTALMLFKPAHDRETVVANLRRADYLFNAVGMARPAAADVPGALSSARGALPKLRAPPDTTGLKQADAAALRTAWYNARLAAVRTILAWGEAADATRLIDACACTTFEAKATAGANVGYLENRLGIIDRGTLAAHARDADPQWRSVAATVLHAYGTAIADAALPGIVNAAPTPDEAREAAWQLLDAPSPEGLSAMRRLIAAPASWDTWPAYLYLLAYGDVSDWRRVAIHPVSYGLAMPLAYLLQFPHDAAGVVLALKQSGDGRTFADAVDTLPAAQRDGEFAWLDAAVSGMPFSGSFTDANRSVAASFFGGNVGMFGPQWIPAVLTATNDQLPDIAANFAAGSYWGESEAQFDYLPQASLEPLLRKAVSATVMPNLDLYLAAHRVTTRESYLSAIDYAGGVERRPFAMRNEDKSGALDGIVEMRPSFSGRTLRIALHVRAAEYGACGAMFGIGCGGDADNAPDQHKLLLDDGRPFVGTVRIERNGKSSDATFVRHDAGWLIYQVPLDAPVLDNAYVSLTLNYLGAHPVLVYDLFASNYARQLRILGERAKAVDAIAQTRPGDPGPPLVAGRLYAAMGQFDTANDRFRSAANETADRAPWQEAAAMFAAAGMHDRAAAVLRDERAKYPHDVAAARDLAGELYQSGDYAGAVRASADVLLDDPGDENAQLLQAMALYLGGDRASVVTVLANDPGRRSPRVLPLWLLASEASNSDRTPVALAEVTAAGAAAREPYHSLLAILAGTGDVDATAASFTAPGDIVRAQTYLGYHYLLAHDDVKATAHFQAALATQETDVLEYRMAQAELAGRRRFPWPLLIGGVLLLALVAGGLFFFRRVRRA